MQIELTKIGSVVKDGKWPKMEVEYIRDGKASKRTLVAIGDTKAVMQELAKTYKAGDAVDITIEKDGDFYNWTAITKAAQHSKAATSFQGKSTYETPEERARKQVYIVRQSSLANAIDYFANVGKQKATKEDVISLAEEFCSFVFQTNGQMTIFEGDAPEPLAKAAPADDFDSDLPF